MLVCQNLKILNIFKFDNLNDSNECIKGFRV